MTYLLEEAQPVSDWYQKLVESGDGLLKPLDTRSSRRHEVVVMTEVVEHSLSSPFSQKPLAVRVSHFPNNRIVGIRAVGFVNPSQRTVCRVSCPLPLITHSYNSPGSKWNA